MGEISVALKNVLSRIEQASSRRILELNVGSPRLLAVTKTKSTKEIIAAYDAGQRHFGENYVQELVDKANSPDILEHCRDIRWHFIGHLQSNKVNKVLSIPNLHMIETVDSIKLAAHLDKSWGKCVERKKKLSIHGADLEKSGIHPTEVIKTSEFVLDDCKCLQFDGLMTIGQFGYDLSRGPNPDFICLRKCGDELAAHLKTRLNIIELSMGMSDDFEHAVKSEMRPIQP